MRVICLILPILLLAGCLELPSEVHQMPEIKSMDMVRTLTTVYNVPSGKIGNPDKLVCLDYPEEAYKNALRIGRFKKLRYNKDFRNCTDYTKMALGIFAALLPSAAVGKISYTSSDLLFTGHMECSCKWSKRG